MTERLIISHLQLNSWSESVKHEIVISWDPTIGAITVSGQLLRTVRFVVGKKNYSHQVFPSMALPVEPHSQRHIERSLSSKLIYYGHNQGKIPSHSIDRVSFLGVVNWNQCHGHSGHQRRQHDTASFTLNMACVTC